MIFLNEVASWGDPTHFLSKATMGVAMRELVYVVVNGDVLQQLK